MLQYKPSTTETVKIPNWYDLSRCKVVAYKTKLVFVEHREYRYSENVRKWFIFDTISRHFTSHPSPFRSSFESMTLFNESIYTFYGFKPHNGKYVLKVDKVNLSFIDENVEPVRLKLPDWKADVSVTKNNQQRLFRSSIVSLE